MSYNYNYRDENGNPAPRYVVIDGCQVWNPTGEMYADAGYLPYVAPTPSAEEVAELQRKARIEELHTLLEKTDYKVIKNYEYQLLGLPLPYDTQEVHDEKQAWRDELNRLENK